MNPTPIEWCQYTWNPIVGCSKRCHDEAGKIWCYAYWQAKRMKQKCDLCYKFVPHIHEERLIEPYNRKKPTNIFVCSMGEFFDPGIPQSWRDEILLVVEENPQHRFMFLTKQPQNIKKMTYPNNMWIGMSLTGKGDTITEEQILYLTNDLKNDIKVKFLSLEPYMGKIDGSIIALFDWIIVGGKTGHEPFTPPKEWVDPIVEWGRYMKRPLFIKSNCQYPEKIKQYPGEKNNGK